MSAKSNIAKGLLTLAGAVGLFGSFTSLYASPQDSDSEVDKIKTVTATRADQDKPLTFCIHGGGGI